MKLLRDFPAVRLTDGNRETPGRSSGFADAARADWNNLEQVVRNCLADAGAKAIVVIEPHVRPDRKAEVVAVDPAIGGAGVPLRYLARSDVTGLHVPRGVLLMPGDQISNLMKVCIDKILIAPITIGTLFGNETPERAFETAFGMSTGRTAGNSGTAKRLALSASLGTDALNGCWWVLGSLAGLLGELDLKTAWARHEVLLSRPDEIPRHIASEARRVRLKTGLPVCALTQDQSRAMKAMLPAWPAENIWQDYVLGCLNIGTKGGASAERYQSAARYIWP